MLAVEVVFGIVTEFARASKQGHHLISIAVRMRFRDCFAATYSRKHFRFFRFGVIGLRPLIDREIKLQGE